MRLLLWIRDFLRGYSDKDWEEMIESLKNLKGSHFQPKNEREKNAYIAYLGMHYEYRRTKWD